MYRYRVLNRGQHVADVEAMDLNSATKAALSAVPWNLARDIPTLERDILSMHFLVDTTNLRAIARHDSYKALAALAVIQFANVDTQIIRLGQNKTFSVFKPEDLFSIAGSIGLTLDLKAKYADQIRALREAVEACDWLALPFTTEQLEEQAYGIAPSDDRPYAFAPDDHKPKRLDKWPFEPQRARKRLDSSYGHEFSAGLGYGAGVVPPPPPAAGKAPPKPPSSPATAVAGPAKAPKPKPPREPSEPAARPKAGTSTGKVWDICDRLWGTGKDHGTMKNLKAEVLEACAAEGINSGTAGVQFGKWKSSKGL